MSKYVPGKDFFCGDFSHVLSLAHHQDFNLAWNFHSHILSDDAKKTKWNLVACKRRRGFPGACKGLGRFLSRVGCRWSSASVLGWVKQAERLSPSSLLSSLLQNSSAATKSSICQWCQNAWRANRADVQRWVHLFRWKFSDFVFLIIEQQSGVSEKGTLIHCWCQPSFNACFPQGQIYSLIIHNADINQLIIWYQNDHLLI